MAIYMYGYFHLEPNSHLQKCLFTSKTIRLFTYIVALGPQIRASCARGGHVARGARAKVCDPCFDTCLQKKEPLSTHALTIPKRISATNRFTCKTIWLFTYMVTFTYSQTVIYRSAYLHVKRYGYLHVWLLSLRAKQSFPEVPIYL